MKSPFIFLKYDHINGEHSSLEYALLEKKTGESESRCIDRFFGQLWGWKPEKDGLWYNFGEFAHKVSSVRDVPVTDAKILQKYIYIS